MNRLAPISPCWNPSRRAFTLLEMMIVLVILGIAASLVTTSAHSLRSAKLDSAARILAGDLRLARNLTLRDGSAWSVQFDLENNAYELQPTGNGSATGSQNPDNPWSATSDAYRVELDSAGARIERVILQDSGEPTEAVAFNDLGGTGPERNENTQIVLRESGHGSRDRIVLTVDWITGGVWRSQ